MELLEANQNNKSLMAQNEKLAMQIQSLQSEVQSLKETQFEVKIPEVKQM